MMRDAHDVLISPVVTENEIGRAVERIWDVTVEDVRTMRYAGKGRSSQMARMAKNYSKNGRRPSFKKAVVKVAEGDHIELYEAG